MQDWATGDAQIIVTAGQLKATSKLRKTFENHRNAYAVGLYDDPPGRAEIEQMLKDAGVQNISGESMTALADLGRELGPGDFAQTLEKLALYKRGDDTPVSHEDIEAVAPRSTEAALDDLLNVVAEARSTELGPLMRRLEAQGTNAVSLVIGATPEGIARLRPPVFGPRRDRMLRQAQNWGAPKLETALTVLTDTDLQLRSAGQTAPGMAVAERALIRLAMLAGTR